MSDESETELNPSELGTLDYWENTYAEDMKNFKDHGDVGKVWFGGKTASKVVVFLNNEIKLSKDAKVIDLGCGNGKLLVDLVNAGFKKLSGVDYSEKAIDLAREVLNDRGITNVELRVCDITAPEVDETLINFQVVNDKGTYDAISLHPENAKEKRQRYTENVKNFLAPEGYFIVTSCNWTKEELVEHFEKYFQMMYEIPTESYRFGGKTGSRVTQLIFIKKR